MSFLEHAEADCFFCFTNLMTDIRDCFIKSLDNSEGGINHIMNRLAFKKLHTCTCRRPSRFSRRLRQVDAATAERLISQDLKPQFFAFRWLTLLLSQEFSLPDVQRLWDSILSDPSR